MQTISDICPRCKKDNLQKSVQFGHSVFLEQGAIHLCVKDRKECEKCPSFYHEVKVGPSLIFKLNSDRTLHKCYSHPELHS